MGLFVYKKQWKVPAVGNKYHILIQHSNARKSFGSFFSFKAECTFLLSVNNHLRLFELFLTLFRINYTISECLGWTLWKQKGSMFTREQVLNKFLKCQHNLEGAEKKEDRKHTHTHPRCGLWEREDDFPVTHYSILFLGLQWLEQQIITIRNCNLLLWYEVNLVGDQKNSIEYYVTAKSSLLLSFSLTW